MKILKRILEKTGNPNLVDSIVERLSLSDLQTLLLEIYGQKVQKIDPKALRRSYMENRFVVPAQIDPVRLNQFDQLAYSLLPEDYEAIALSPVAPIGTSSVIAPINQNNVLTTIRNTEVLSDSTNVLALESAKRRHKFISQKDKANTVIKLCSSHRQLRTQTFDEKAAFPHFTIFCLTSAGRDTGNQEFEKSTLREHIEYYLMLFNKLHRIDLFATNIRIKLIVINPHLEDMIRNNVIKEISEKDKNIQFEVIKEKAGNNTYYCGLRFQIFAKNKKGEEYFLIDGGLTDWTQKLLSSRKERFLSSGIGSERLLFCFKK